jgi:hypothetical protein
MGKLREGGDPLESLFSNKRSVKSSTDEEEAFTF